jgi:hypothetical protein
MSQKLYLIVSGSVFVLVGMFHLLRLITHWPIMVGPWSVPHSISYVGCPVSVGYAIWAAWLLFAPSRGGKRSSQ